jgi:SH3-like domain-containing protein
MKTIRSALIAAVISAGTLFVGYAGVSANSSVETISAHRSPIKPPKGRRVCTATTTLSVRRNHKASSPVVGSIAAGTVVSVNERENGWMKVRAGGVRGWVRGGVSCTR